MLRGQKRPHSAKVRLNIFLARDKWRRFNFEKRSDCIRGRPLMIWGGAGGNFRNEFIFFREPLPHKFFFLSKASQSFFFSWRDGASQNFFFPWECLSKFIFSWRRASEIFFLDFPRPPPQVINGRSLVAYQNPYYSHIRLLLCPLVLEGNGILCGNLGKKSKNFLDPHYR